MDRCLDRLGVTAVPVVVLTHFHADHVDGLAGVLQDRAVGSIHTTALAEPAGGVAQVAAVARSAGVPVRVAELGEQWRVGAVAWQVVGPVRPVGPGEEGSAANNASLVLSLRVGGVRLLLTGDMEPEAQELLSRTSGRLRADVVKVPHHGSRHQDAEFLTDLGARLAVISVGEDNDYGHPAPETLALLEEAGTLVRRTDVAGDIAVVRDGTRLRVVTSR